MRDRYVALAAAAAGLALSSASAQAPGPLAGAPQSAPVNPYLADSAYPIGHHNSAQQDSTLVRGPEGPSRALGPADYQLRFVGPGHFGALLSAPYPDGRRVLWSNGSDRLVKLDARTFEVLAVLPKAGAPRFDQPSADAAFKALNDAPAAQKPGAALRYAATTMAGLAGVYTLIDRDNRVYVGSRDGVAIYGDAQPGHPESPIKLLGDWHTPHPMSGAFVGLNITYDGWIILVSEGGAVVALSRDLKRSVTTRLQHSDEAADYTRRAEAAGRVGYGWVRNSYAVDRDGGIYIVSAGYLHKVVWTGARLSTDPADGAWVARYRDGTGLGSGSTPALMGFGAEDRLVVITDGDRLMNVTAFWRDAPPAGWKAPPGAADPRVAGYRPADMGDPALTAIQSEQAVVIAGNGALVVNNQPASIPAGYPPRAASLLVGLLGSDPRFTPHGLQKFMWDGRSRTLTAAWANREVASPNTVPFVSIGSNLAYTIGVRSGRWTLEGLDWTTGASRFHYKLPDENFNALFAGLTMDGDGNIIYGSPLRKIKIFRVAPKPN